MKSNLSDIASQSETIDDSLHSVMTDNIRYSRTEIMQKVSRKSPWLAISYDEASSDACRLLSECIPSEKQIVWYDMQGAEQKYQNAKNNLDSKQKTLDSLNASLSQIQTIVDVQQN